MELSAILFTKQTLPTLPPSIHWGLKDQTQLPACLAFASGANF
jgi:hypothetical protein